MLTKIENKAFYKSVIALVVPMTLQNLVNVGVQSADVVMLGRVGEVVLSASSLAGQVQFVMMLFFFGLASGAMVLTAQYWGKGDTRTIEKVMGIALRLALAVAAVFTIAAFFFPGQIMRIFSPDQAVIAEGIKYLRIVSLSYLCMAFSNTYLNIMRSVERVIISTVVYFISFLINVVLNAILIFGLLGFPAMGIAGAAIATTTARVIELIIVIFYLKYKSVLKVRLKDLFASHKTLFKDFIRYAAPTTFNELFWGLAMSAMAVIIGHLGKQAVSAYSVAQVVRQLATVVCFGIANATAIMMGKTIGAGEKEKAVAYSRRFMKLTMLAALAGSLIIFFLRPFVVSAMELSPQAEDYLRFLLLYMSFYVLAQAWNATLIIGIFRGGGDTRFGLVLDVCVMWGASILWGSLAAFAFGLPVKVVFIIIMLDEFIKIPFSFVRYRSRSWLRDVTRPVND